MTDRERFILLLEKYITGNITPAERSEFMDRVASQQFDDLLLRHMDAALNSKDVPASNTALPAHRSEEILHKILSAEKQSNLLVQPPPQKIRRSRWMAAAAVLLVLAASAYFFTRDKQLSPQPATPSYAGMIEKLNQSERPLTVALEDGTKITLGPGSGIHYPAHFLDLKREVYLEGEAFFEVAKNPDRPFFVYDKNIVTRVLGTSFTIRTGTKDRKMEVTVRTGRVEVYENKPDGKKATDKKDNGVILLPNQKVTYDQATNQFIPAVADSPQPLAETNTDKKAAAESFVFEETSLRKVLSALEKAYGIEIIAENENIYKCLFTGDVGSQDLFGRLDIICQAVQASYEVKGTKILVKGNGCK